MTLLAAQGRTAAILKDAVKVYSFNRETMKELGTFIVHINDLIEMNSWVHKMLTATASPGGGDQAGGWLAVYRREVLAITLNF